MHIIELIYPGMSVDHPDEQWSYEVWDQIHNFETPLAEAALALTWFEEQRTATHSPGLQEEWEQDFQRRAVIKAKIVSESNLDHPSTIDVEQQISLLTEIELKREKWNRGILPRIYSHHIIFVHAKSFLYALDRIDKQLRVLETTLSDQFDISSIVATFAASVPDLRGVRNSVAHHEDRSRGLDNKQKPIMPKPVSNALLDSLGGALILESLNGNKFGSTMADGHYGEVDVSLATLKASGVAVQSVINVLKWTGSPEHWPR